MDIIINKINRHRSQEAVLDEGTPHDETNGYGKCSGSLSNNYVNEFHSCFLISTRLRFLRPHDGEVKIRKDIMVNIRGRWNFGESIENSPSIVCGCTIG